MTPSVTIPGTRLRGPRLGVVRLLPQRGAALTGRDSERSHGMSELDLGAIEARANAAATELSRMIREGRPTPGLAWRWSIPAQPERDTDLILSASTADVPALVARVRELEAKVAAAADLAESSHVVLPECLRIALGVRQAQS